MVDREVIAMIGGLVLVSAGYCPAQQATRGQQMAAEREFTLNVLPVLKSKCFGCHGDDPDELRGQFDARSRGALIEGGESGEPALIPGKPDQSPFFQAINWEGLEMPPKETDRLSEAQILLIRHWIESNAPWPDERAQRQYREEARSVRETAEGVIVDTSGGTSDEWTYRRYRPADLWAWRPVGPTAELREAVPVGENPVDFLVRQGLAQAGFEPAPRASAETLIRRATYDLIGLPPTPREIDTFRSDWNRDSRKAWTALIERLLASPRYGEHWAQHWLDVTRYADTGGMSNDFERSNMWRYRDYVIRAFNDDKPYNQFIVEQIAGDELADASVRERFGNDEAAVLAAQVAGDYGPEEAENIVATGFLRLGPWDNAMTETAEARQIYLDDVVNLVGQTFLSTTLRCVKCHDHKFDPIPTRDYYRIYAAFSATQMAERPVPFSPSENQAGFAEGKRHVHEMLAFAVRQKKRIVAKREAAAKAWFDERELPYQDADARKSLPDTEKPPRHVGLDYIDEGELKVREQDEWIWTRRLERYAAMAQSVYNAGETVLQWNGARKLRIDRKADRQNSPPSYILTGGALNAIGDAVEPGVLSATGLPVNVDREDPYVLTSDVSGRRLELARWIADPRNPLTARSFVNRVWQHHFGRGLAGNPNNFGAKGAKPTHPELLDFLAADLVEHGWKLKRLHRLLMLTETYQQASQHPEAPELANKDPNNHLWAYYPQRRLTSEELRDSMLFATGELVQQTGGLPIMPEINLEVALQPRMIQFSLAPAYQPSPTPDLRNRRTIYAYRVRGQADPFLELFNQPNPNESCEMRDTAAVTPQALTLLNSDVVTDRSIAMAVHLQADHDNASAQISAAFQHILGREPAPAEQTRLFDYVNEMTAYHQGTAVERRQYPKQVTRSVVEEFSGKPFEYREILPVFERYRPDVKAADVPADTRALADMCLLLFNTNEFMFLR